MYFRFRLSCLILLVCLSCTALARSNGPRSPAPRHHRRREVTLSEWLTPPPPPLQKNRPNPLPQNAPFRQGKIMNHVPSPVPQSKGFFARFMGWFNPWTGDSPPSQGLQNFENNHPGFQASVKQVNSYGTPPPVQSDTHGAHQPRFSFPQTSHNQLPALTSKDCHPCDKIPWIPIIQGTHINNRYAEVSPGISLNDHHQDLESQNNFHVPSPSHEVKLPDFGWDHPPPPPQEFPQHSINTYNTDYPSPLTGPIPNPHLYPGAMPPLFKAGPWDWAPASTDQADQFRNDGPGIDPRHEQLSSGNSNNPFNSLNFDTIVLSGPSHSGDYVDVLPPGAETASGPEHIPPSHPEGVTDPGTFTSGTQSNVHQPGEHETASASLNPVFGTHQHENQGSSATDHHDVAVNQPTDLGTKVSADGQHVIHIEQSPVIDLSEDDSESKDSNTSGVTEDAPLILQNADGTYGINMTWPSDSGFVGSSSGDQDTSVSSTIQVSKNKNAEQSRETTLIHEQQIKLNENVTSLLLDALRNSTNSSEYGQRIVTTTQEPYRTDEGELSLEETERPQSTTEEPLYDAIVRSYNKIKEEEELEQETAKPLIDPKDIHVGAGFSPSSGTSRGMRPPDNQQQGGKRNKQVQIIIPYTSQYTPSPFHHGVGSWSDPGKIQPRKVPVSSTRDRSKESIEATEEERSHILQTLESLPKLRRITRPFLLSKTNTSIDPLRLQKNIDNWTIQEYSRGTTVSTAVPSSFHRLQQSKKIPDEYFTTTEPVATIKEAEKTFGNILDGFNSNYLDHEGSASSRIEVPHVGILSSEKINSSSEPTTEPPSSSEDLSWEQLPVSISPFSNERVYIVTPQPASKSKGKSLEQVVSKEQFESIERAYQVLPEAVNNLAVASTGPATLPLWGIMEHEEYAKNVTTTSPKTPILYSGHSKVSHTRQ